MASFVKVDQLKTALERVKQYTEDNYIKESHTHTSDKIVSLPGFQTAADTGEKHVAIFQSDSLNEALGKLDRSIVNIINNIGEIQSGSHNHNDLYYKIADIDQMLDTMEQELTSKAEGSLGSAKSYTDEKIRDLVDTAPETLDTLNDLAAALGNDPNFAASLTESIGKKVNKPTMATNGNVAVFNTNGAGVEDSGYTLAASVPSNAKFTDQNVTVNNSNFTKLYVTGCEQAGTGELKYDSGIYIDTESGTLVANTFSGTATSANTAGTSNKVNNPLTVKIGGSTQWQFDGSEAKTLSITASDIGALTAGDIPQPATDTEINEMLTKVFG